jgi:hypothetical protein
LLFLHPQPIEAAIHEVITRVLSKDPHSTAYGMFFFLSYFDVFGPTFVRFFIRKSGKWYHKKKEKPRENTQSKLETQEEMSDVLGELVAR